MSRGDGRKNSDIRMLTIDRNYTMYAPGSVLIACGNTKVLCTASYDLGVPRFLKDSGSGWLTAEYAMLPSATHSRSQREVYKGRVSGRSSEIQRLIGRSLRASLDLKLLGERSIYIDADVIQADGGTRTAAITGGMLALSDAVAHMLKEGIIRKNPIKRWISAVSVGKYKGELMCDLSYEEDSKADLDMNLVMTSDGEIVEIQGTAERMTITKDELTELLSIGESAIQQIVTCVRS